MKKVLTILFLAVVLLCSCGEKNDAEGSLELPETNWGMTVDEVLDVYEVTKEETGAYNDSGRGTAFTIGEQEIFGAEASSVHFSFLNLKPDESGSLAEYDEDEEKGLCAVTVAYPEGTDLDKVLKNMKKQYGATVSQLNVYPYLSPLADIDGLGIDGEIPSNKYTDAENTKLWAGDSVFESIPEKERESYGELWEVYQKGLSSDNWEDYSKTSVMTYIILNKTQEGAISVQFSGYNLMVYEQLKSQLSE